MLIDLNGAIISTVTAVQNSVLGEDYVVMWDFEGLPIHLHKAVIDALYHAVYYDKSLKSHVPAPSFRIEKRQIF